MAGGRVVEGEEREGKMPDMREYSGMRREVRPGRRASLQGKQGFRYFSPPPSVLSFLFPAQVKSSPSFSMLFQVQLPLPMSLFSAHELMLSSSICMHNVLSFLPPSLRWMRR